MYTHVYTGSAVSLSYMLKKAHHRLLEHTRKQQLYAKKGKPQVVGTYKKTTIHCGLVFTNNL